MKNMSSGTHCDDQNILSDPTWNEYLLFHDVIRISHTQKSWMYTKFKSLQVKVTKAVSWSIRGDVALFHKLSASGSVLQASCFYMNLPIEM